MLEGDVGGDDNGAMLVAFGDELEQQLSTSKGGRYPSMVKTRVLW